MSDAKSKPTTSTEVRTGPGRLLRQARLDLRLDPEEVAEILHLSAKQINALERDDYQALPGPTYIRGYLRSYAQLLGLVPETIVDAYNHLTLPQKPLLPPQSSLPPQMTSSNRMVKAASLGVVAVVLGLVYVWWQNTEETFDLISPSPVVSEQAVPKESVATVSPSETPVTTASPANGLSDTKSPVDTPTIETPVKKLIEAPPATTQKPVTVSGMILNVSPEEKSKVQTQATPTPERPVMRTSKPITIPPDVPRARMVVVAVEESWADVRDARDNRLLYENVPAGRRISLEGVAPFSVFLGNADGVKVEFNGKEYDISRYKRGQVARFTLGEAAQVNN